MQVKAATLEKTKEEEGGGEEIQAGKRTHVKAKGGYSRECVIYKDMEGQGKEKGERSAKIMYEKAIMNALYANLKIDLK